MRSVELFSGAGGLALGLEAAGFEHVALIEHNKDACATLRINRPDWNVIESDGSASIDIGRSLSGSDLTWMQNGFFLRRSHHLMSYFGRNMYQRGIGKSISSPNPLIPPSLQARVARIRTESLFQMQSRWKTVRNALKGLPHPKVKSEYANHTYQEGAKSYPGHTGSPWDEPAKALKAGDHGVPGGENMLDCGNGKVRYFSVRESARIQTFPDDYVFSGSWTESMRQLGNAVPVALAQVVASSISRHLQILHGQRISI